MWGPLGALTLWGGAYLRSCYDVLCAPGVPVSITYQAKGGELRFEATSYIADPLLGDLRLNSPRILDKAGRPIAQARLVRLRDLKPIYGADQVIKVQVSSLSGRVVRLDNGQLEVAQYLPESKGPPSRIPFSVAVDSARLTLEDRTSGSIWRQPITLHEVQVDGVGEDWLAHSRATLNIAKGVHAWVQHVSGGDLVAEVSTSGLDATEIVRHFAPKREFTAESLHVAGSARLSYRPNSKLQLRSNVAAIGTGLVAAGYAIDRGDFSGMVTLDGAAGKASALSGETKADFDGAIDWSKPVAMGGQLTASSSGPAALPSWARKLIPPKSGFEGGTFKGYLAMRKGLPQLSGTVEANSVVYDREVIQSPAANISLDLQKVNVGLTRGTTLGKPLNGQVFYNFKQKNLNGFVQVPQVDLGRLANRLGTQGVAGSGKLQAQFEGPVGQLHLDWVAVGEGKYTSPSSKTYPFGCFEIVGQLDAGKVHVDRGFVDGPLGVGVIAGEASLSDQLDLSVKLRGIQASRLDPEALGTANFEGRLRGTVDRPHLEGRLEAYGAGYRDERIPAATAQVAVDRYGAKVYQLKAVRGTAQVAGDVAYRFADGEVTAGLSAQRMQLAEFLGEDYVGLVDVPQVIIRGVRNRYSGAGRFQANTIVAKGVKVDGVYASFEANNRALIVRSAGAKVAGGSVSASGRYNYTNQTGIGHVIAKDLGLDGLTTPFTTDVSLAGKTSADAWIAFHEGRISASGHGELEEVALNHTPIGSGPFSISTDTDRTELDVSIGLATGALLRTLEAEKLVIRSKDREASGNIYIHNLKVEDFADTALGLARDVPSDLATRISSLKGTVDAGIKIAGPWANPDVQANDVHIGGLEVSGVELGDLAGSFSRVDKKWTVPKLSLKGPQNESLTLSGTGVEEGAIDASLIGRELQLSRWSALAPNASLGSGVVGFDLYASGPFRRPAFRASANAKKLFANPKIEQDLGVYFSIDNLSVSEADGFSMEGEYGYEGFGGTFTGAGPFRYPFVPSESPVTAVVTLKPRALNEIEGLAGTLDPLRTDGTIGGTLNLAYASGEVKGSGKLTLNAKQIGMLSPSKNSLGVTRVDTSLRDVTADVSLDQNSLAIKADAVSSEGGSLSVRASVADLVQTLRAEGMSGLLNRAIEGDIALKDLTVKQSMAGRAHAFGAADGAVKITGTVAHPMIDGGLSLSGVDVTMPTITPSTSEETNPVVNPDFNLRFGLKNPARVSTSTADLTLIGDGSLLGTLSAPVATANLVVDRGTIRLPGGLVRLSSGGTLDFSLQSLAGSPYATFNMDVQGKTSITAQRYNETIQRYQITLDIKGDLLKEGGLNMTAESDPPDLSQDRILASLGRTSLLTAFSSGGNQTDTERQLREAFVGYALPSLLDSVTGNLAKSLGLEYLSLEYNPLDLTTVTVGKTLGTEFSLQARRQLGEPLPGYKPLYDFRILYTPRWGPKAFRRLILSAGSDQDRPWKVALEYGYRFGGFRPNTPEKPATVISSPERP